MASISAEMYAAAFNPIENLQSVFAFLLMGSLTNLIALFHNFDETKDQFKARRTDTRQTFDFIVVGAGSAGSIIANRLSKDYSVLLLEAGGEPSPISEIPIVTLTMLNRPHVDWQFYTVPQKNAFFAMDNRQGYQPRGLGLGGSSNINAMIYMKGHPDDFDAWANITRDPRWSHEQVLPIFKHLEDYRGKWEDSEYHSQGGELKVSPNRYSIVADDFVKAGVEMGYVEADLNARSANAFSKIFLTQNNGRRYGTVKAFIEPARQRNNLSIYKFARAHKILFQSNENEAYGIEYERHGVMKTAFANREIIISAGAIMSPHLLMHSGIGPKAHLESFNIPVICDLPVGKNLQDHIIGLIPFLHDKPKPQTSRDPFTEYRLNGTGMFSTSSTTASAYLVSSFAKDRGEGDRPDNQWILQETDIYKGITKDLSNNFNIPESTFNQFFDPVEGKSAFFILNMLSRPKQRGDIMLASSNPRDYPLINPNYLSEPEDLKILIEGAQRAMKLVQNSTTFQAINGRPFPFSFPGCETTNLHSDEYWECYHKQQATTLYHICGTCAMGHKDSKEAVVDSELRVLGTKGLRVIDASVMPLITTGNTNAPTIMIGERGAQLIKAHWSSSTQLS